MRRIAVAAAAGIAVAVLSNHPAVAYVGTSGTGSKAQTVTAGQTLTATGSAQMPANGSAVAVDTVATNHDTFHRWVHSVAASFGSANNGCTSAGVRITGSPVTLSPSQVIAAQGTLHISGIKVQETSNACKNATVTLTYTVG